MYIISNKILFYKIHLCVHKKQDFVFEKQADVQIILINNFYFIYIYIYIMTANNLRFS